MHSFGGIGLGKEPAVQLADMVASKVHAARRWQGCRALVIDEVSMLDGALFEKLDFVARQVRRGCAGSTDADGNDEPFGGIQCAHHERLLTL